MSERYSKKDIDSGLLYYLHTDQTMGIKVERSDLVGLIMRRNELATDILKASNTQRFPPMLQSPTMCKGCRHLNICTVYHKAHGGNSESSGLGDAFDSLVNHLSTADFNFLNHWDRLIDLEAKASQVGKKGFLRLEAEVQALGAARLVRIQAEVEARMAEKEAEVQARIAQLEADAETRLAQREA